MQWSPKGALLLLQMRTRVLNGELEQIFRDWHPGFRIERGGFHWTPNIKGERHTSAHNPRLSHHESAST